MRPISTDQPHSIGQELAWLRSEGPTSPGLVHYIRRHAERYDFLVFFSFRYYHAYHGIRAAPERAVLVPTAERESAVGLSIFAPVFRGVRGIMYNSPEEQAMIQAVSDNAHVPGVVVGVGSNVPARTAPQRFRRTHGLAGPFIVYVGRIDENKGCKELFDFFLRYASARSRSLSLVLIGIQVKIHMHKLEELEYVLVHRGGRGQAFVYELLYNGEGKQGEAFVIGLLDVQQLKQGCDSKKVRPEANREPSGSPQVAERETGCSGSQMVKNALIQGPDRRSGTPDPATAQSAPEVAPESVPYRWVAPLA